MGAQAVIMSFARNLVTLVFHPAEEAKMGDATAAAVALCSVLRSHSTIIYSAALQSVLTYHTQEDYVRATHVKGGCLFMTALLEKGPAVAAAPDLDSSIWPMLMEQLGGLLTDAWRAMVIAHPSSSTPGSSWASIHDLLRLLKAYAANADMEQRQALAMELAPLLSDVEDTEFDPVRAALVEM